MIGVIFDVDGVIIDVKESYHYAIKYTAEEFLNRELPIEEVRRIKFSRGINNDWLATFEVIKEYGKEADLKEIIERFNSVYRSLRDKERLMLSPEFFKSLREQGLSLGVLTGRPKEDLEYAFDRFGLWEYFDFVVHEETIPQEELRKPHPYALHFCIEGLNAEKAVYIGDSLADWSMVKDYKRLYEKPVAYIHMGEPFGLEGVILSCSERLLEDLQEVLRSL